MASRRNRRPRVCVCPPAVVPTTPLVVQSFDGGALDSFVEIEFTTDYQVVANPFDQLVSPPTLTINGVDAMITGIAPVTLSRFALTFVEVLLSGDVLELTVPENCYAVVGLDGGLITAGVYNQTVL